jgi:hypothetical protein
MSRLQERILGKSPHLVCQTPAQAELDGRHQASDGSHPQRQIEKLGPPAWCFRCRSLCKGIRQAVQTVWLTVSERTFAERPEPQGNTVFRPIIDLPPNHLHCGDTEDPWWAACRNWHGPCTSCVHLEVSIHNIYLVAHRDAVTSLTCES